MTNISPSFPSIGLALGGGGARGLAHIGLLDTFLQWGVTPHFVSGTSMGAIIAAAFAMGIPTAELTSIALKFTKTSEMVKLVDWSPPRRGFLEGKKVQGFLESVFGTDTQFEDLKIPLAINSVDLCTGQEIIFTSGSLITAMMSSIAVPGIFQPYEVGDYQLVDGGVLNNVPVSLLAMFKPNLTIAVDVQINPRRDPHWINLPQQPHWPLPLPDVFLEFYRAELIMLYEITQQKLNAYHPDILISPNIPVEITPFLGFPKAKEIIEIGALSARENLPDILALLERIK